MQPVNHVQTSSPETGPGARSEPRTPRREVRKVHAAISSSATLRRSGTSRQRRQALLSPRLVLAPLRLLLPVVPVPHEAEQQRNEHDDEERVLEASVVVEVAGSAGAVRGG